MSSATTSRSAAATRDVLLVALTLTTGAVDGTAFLMLGRVFSSVITGNLVLLGVAAGDHAGSPALHAAIALAGYCAGVAVGAPIAARDWRLPWFPAGVSGAAWPVSVTVTLLAELSLLITFCVTWELTPGPRRSTGAVQLALLVLLSAAMGMQSAAVRRLGQMSTTYLTSTLTGLIAGLATRRLPPGAGRSAGVLVTLVAGATAAALLTAHAPAVIPLVVAGPALVVTGIAVARREHLGSSAPPPGGTDG